MLLLMDIHLNTYSYTYSSCPMEILNTYISNYVMYMYFQTMLRTDFKPNMFWATKSCWTKNFFVASEKLLMSCIFCVFYIGCFLHGTWQTIVMERVSATFADRTLSFSWFGHCTSFNVIVVDVIDFIVSMAFSFVLICCQIL